MWDSDGGIFLVRECGGEGARRMFLLKAFNSCHDSRTPSRIL